MGTVKGGVTVFYLYLRGPGRHWGSGRKLTACCWKAKFEALSAQKVAHREGLRELTPHSFLSPGT